ncbi:hypothetical protein [Microcoleus sp. OTE_8_concoct_300]|uniref:hypothetical protein n=1 Tax=Microcoleus sp. OTE_8_concoct_300 TaxID=2964710 RepID=UPI00403FAFCD
MANVETHLVARPSCPTPSLRTAAPVRSATIITRPNQIKAVLEDELDACAIELAADIAVATQ